ncbi:MAG: RHS repeat-associated core domain-containing protein [Alcanivoracaceae bacterium]
MVVIKAFLSLLLLVAFCRSAVAESRYHAWEVPGAGDQPNIVIKEVNYTPVGDVIIPRYEGEEHHFCSGSNGVYVSCHLGSISRLLTWKRLNVHSQDINQDGVLDFVLQANRPGSAHYIVYSRSYGSGYQAARLHFDGADYSGSTLSKDAKFAFTGGSSGPGMSLHTSSGQVLGFDFVQNSDGDISAGKLYRRDIPNGKQVSGRLVSPTLPDVTGYTIDINGRGGLTSSIPLSFPSGLNGQSIDLRVAYSGGAVPGSIGAGWDFVGIPAIKRCARSADVEMNPDLVGGYRFTDEHSFDYVDTGVRDVFCGEAGRLVKSVGGGGFAGTYRYHASPDRWVVASVGNVREMLPDGVFYEYTAGVVKDGANPDNASFSNTLSWVPKRRVNRFGNVVDFSYLRVGAEVNVKTIQYDDVVIEFRYENVPTMIRFLGGHAVPGDGKGVKITQQSGMLLTSIEARVRGIKAKEYYFGYAFDRFSIPRLSHVQQCGAADLDDAEKCGIPVRFTYSGQHDDVVISVSDNYVSIPLHDDSKLNEAIEIDFDGDGIIDLLSARTSSPTGATTVRIAYASDNYGQSHDLSSALGGGTKHLFTAIDHDMDGQAGFVFLARGPDKTVTTSHNTQTTSVYFSAYPSLTYQQQQGLTNCRQTSANYRAIYPDRWWVCDKTTTSTTSGTFATFSWRYYDSASGLRTIVNEAICILPSDVSAFLNGGLGSFRPRVVNAFGQGWKDIILRRQSVVSGCGHSAGSGIYSGGAFQQKGSVAVAAMYSHEVDLNGDGRPDLIAADQELDRWKIVRHALSSGQNRYLTSAGNGGSEYIPVTRTIPVDINGDGRTDMLTARPDADGVLAWFVYLNNGVDFEPPHRMSAANDVDMGLTRTRKEDLNVRVFDYNGSPFPSILLATKNQNYIVYETYFGADGLPYFNVIDTRITVSADLANIRILDVTGNGIQDVAEFHQGTIRLIGFEKPLRGLLTQIRQSWPDRDPSHTSTNISWTKPGNNSGVYVHEVIAPNSENVSRIHRGALVERISRPSSHDQPVVTNYVYKTAILNKHQNRLLGFAEIRSSTPALNEKRVVMNILSPSDAAIPMLAPRREEKYFSSGNGERLLSRVDYGLVLYKYETCLSGWPQAIVPHYWNNGVGTRPSCVVSSRETRPFLRSVGSRTTEYDSAGVEWRSVSSVSHFDSRGTTIRQVVETGVGPGADSCASSTSCLGVTALQHTQETLVTPLYVGTDFSGPTLSVPAQIELRSFWAPSAMPQVSGLPQNVSQSSLLGQRKEITAHQWTIQGASASQWRLTLSKTTSLKGTGRESVTDFSYTGTGSSLRQSGSVLGNGVSTATMSRLAVPRSVADGGWDAYGFPTTTTYGDASSTLTESYQINRHFNGLNYSQDENGLRTDYGYGSDGGLTKVTHPDASQDSVAYGFCGYGCPLYPVAVRYVDELLASGKGRTSYYDLLGREVAVREEGYQGTSRWTYREYDDKGRLIAQSMPCVGTSCSAPEYTVWEYDDIQDEVVQIRPDGGTTRTYRQGMGGVGGYQLVAVESVTAEAQAVGNAAMMLGKITVFDVLGNTVRVVDHGPQAAAETELAYDPFGNLVWSRVGGLQASVLVRVYDAASSVIHEYDPSAGRTSVVWNIAGELVSSTRWGLSGVSAGAITTHYTYDSLGRLARKQVVGDPREARWYYDVDSSGASCGKGFLCEMSFSDGSFVEGYSWYLSQGGAGAGRMQSRHRHTGGGNFNFSYAYSHFGAIENIVYPNGRVLERNYQNGYLISVGEDGVDYYTVGGYGQFDRPTSVGLSAVGAHQAFSYDPRSGRLLGHTLTTAGFSRHYHYGYDSKGRMLRREQVTDQGVLVGEALTSREHFGYDGLGRVVASELEVTSGADGVLIGAASASYGYDVLGNILDYQGVGSSYGYQYQAGECSQGVMAPGPHALRKRGDSLYCYDRFGNVTQAGVRSYQWSASHTAPIAISEGALAAAFDYGPDGSKIWQNITNESGATQTWYAGDGYEAAVSGESAEIRTYVDGLLVLQDDSIKPRYIVSDALGSTSLIITPSEAGSSQPFQILDAAAYDAFGIKRSGDWLGSYGGMPESDRGFTGHDDLSSFGLIHMKGRVYDPAIGRFLSPDILIQDHFNAQSYNRYSYAWNNPLGYVDPTGYALDPLNDYELGMALADPLSMMFHRTFNHPQTLTSLDLVDFSVGAFGATSGELGQFVVYGVGGLVSLFSIDYADAIFGYGDNVGGYWAPENLDQAYGSGASVLAVFGGFAKVGKDAVTGLYRGFSPAVANKLPSKLYLYTDEATAALIEKSQLGLPGRVTYLTPKGGLTPLQAQIELALPQNNTAGALFEISTKGLNPSKVLLQRDVTGNVFNRGGGGFEILFDGPIPLEFVTRIK